MSMRLRDTDGRAVDLLLDRALMAQGNGNGNGHATTASFATSHASVSNEQVAAVEKVLHLLHAMPAADPGPDLVRRTLERIGAHTDSPMRGATTPALIDLSRPVA